MIKSCELYRLQFVFLIHFIHTVYIKGEGKAVPLRVWRGPDGSRKLRFPDYMETAQDGVEVVSLTHRPSLPPGNVPGTHFSYRLS